MDPIIKKKLDKFSELVHGEIRQQNATAKAACDAAAAAEIESKGQALNDEAEAFYEQRIAQTKAAMQEALSGAQGETRRDTLEMRKAILNETVLAIRERATQFVEQASYQSFIKAKLAALTEQLAASDHLIIAANRADWDWLRQDLAAQPSCAKLDFKELHPAEIGGVIVELPTAHVRYNITLKSMIEANIDHIGAKLYMLFEEMEN